MNFKDARFEIVKNFNCPLYQVGDVFKVSGRTLSIMGKSVCLSLMADMTAVLLGIQNAPPAAKTRLEEKAVNCSGEKTGCGTLRFRYLKEGQRSKINGELAGRVAEINNFSMFKTLCPEDVSDIISYFNIQDFKSGQIILRKGDRGEKLFVMLSGLVEIIGDYGVSIATLGRGEIFGEMSLLTGNPISTKVRVMEDARTMYIPANHFRMLLAQYSSLQMFFVRLLAQRLARSNVERSKQVSSGMTGNLSEISTTELLQALNLSEKTGVLSLFFPKGEGRISLQDGDIIGAEFQDMSGEAAFFAIMQEKRGKFQFKAALAVQEMGKPKLGDFMYLMMEAANQEDDAADPSDSPEE